MQIKKFITGIIIIVLLCNVSLIECGLNNKLAIPHQSGSAHEASVFMRISQFMELIVGNSIDSMRELARFRYRLDGINGFISKDIIRKNERAYYMFFPKERFYCRVTTAKRVDDKIGALVQRLTKELNVPFVKSKLERIEIGGRKFYCRYYTIPRGKEELFNIFLNIFNSHLDKDGEPVREGLEYKNSFPGKIETKYLLFLFNILSIISLIPFFQIFFIRQYLHILRNRSQYVLINYVASFLSIIILVPLVNVLCGISVSLGFILTALFLALNIDIYIYRFSTIRLLKRFSENKLREHRALITLELIKTSARIIHSGNVETHPLYKTLEGYLYAIEARTTFSLNYLGEIIGETGTKGAKISAAISKIRAIYKEGIFGVVKKVTLIDGGAPVLYEDKEILIDKSAVENEAVLENILIYGFSKSILELVEDDLGIREVTAIYQSIKHFNGLSKSQKRALITFWARNGNTDYAELLQFISDKHLSEEQLIGLIAVYLSTTPLYQDLKMSLQELLDRGVANAKSAKERFGLTVDICGEFISDSHALKIIIDKIKAAESNMNKFHKEIVQFEASV